MKIKTETLTKIYPGNVVGIQDITLEIGKGIFGLLGPNGAGKTTLMQILATLTRPTRGQVYFNGASILARPRLIRKVLGYLPQEFGFYNRLTGYEFMMYMANLKGIDRSRRRAEVLQRLDSVGLTNVKGRRIKGYSGGMKQRLAFAQALLNDPKVLIVDEPTSGLDPEERVKFRNLLKNLGGERTVILSTHILQDVEMIADNLAIIRKGGIIVRGTPSELIAEMKGKVWELITTKDRYQQMEQTHVISSAYEAHEGLKLRAIGEGAPIERAQPVPPTLEDAYLYFIKEQSHASGGKE
jgi:ABC-type multidrug transport system ATPase subunit